MSKVKAAASWPFSIQRPPRSKEINYSKFNGETVMKLEDKLVKVNDNFTVYMYDNGYMLEISGRDNNEDWATAKILCKDLDELIVLIKEASSTDRD
jgi:hypothetical protein